MRFVGVGVSPSVDAVWLWNCNTRIHSHRLRTPTRLWRVCASLCGLLTQLFLPVSARDPLLQKWLRAGLTRASGELGTFGSSETALRMCIREMGFRVEDLKRWPNGSKSLFLCHRLGGDSIVTDVFMSVCDD